MYRCEINWYYHIFEPSKLPNRTLAFVNTQYNGYVLNERGCSTCKQGSIDQIRILKNGNFKPLVTGLHLLINNGKNVLKNPATDV